MNTLSFLENLGLTNTEIALYELLLKKGQTPVGMIIRESGIKRPTVYKALYSLEKKGLVTQKDIKKKIHFSPEPPTKLMEQTDTQYNALRHVKENLQALMPELTSSYIQSVEKPVVKEYVGIEGLKEVYKDIYGKKEEPVYGCVELEKIDDAIPSYALKNLIPLRIRNKVFAKSFFNSSSQGVEVKKNDAKSLRETVLLEKTKYPLPAEIDVYDDKVAMLSFQKGDFVGLIIQNKDFATSIKSIFKLAFEKSYQSPVKPRAKIQ